MLKAPAPKDPVVFSYLALRKAVGTVALALPFAVAIPWGLRYHAIQTSISAYYYTGMRNLFVGSLCAIAMFMLCTRGYDRKDEVAGIFSAVCGIGVAFCPTSPECCATNRQLVIGTIHYIFAALLFLTLAYFCLVLFRMSAVGHAVTRKKKQRNVVYTVCGIVILLSLALLPSLTFLIHKLGKQYLFAGIAPGIFLRRPRSLPSVSPGLSRVGHFSKTKNRSPPSRVRPTVTSSPTIPIPADCTGSLKIQEQRDSSKSSGRPDLERTSSRRALRNLPASKRRENFVRSLDES